VTYPVTPPLYTRSMTKTTRPRFDGTLALQLDFGDLTTTTFPAARPINAGLKLTARPAGVRSPDKYKALEHRRRQAQITARKALGLF
jgi:hypothetical protein